MGFNLTSFGAGFASAATEDMKQARKLAELRGFEAVKNLQANYKTVLEENKKKESELVGNIDLLRSYDPTATETELYAVATKKPVMDAITGLIKNDGFDAASFKLANFAKVANENTTATALERVKELSAFPIVARQTIADQQKPSGNILKDLVDRSSSRAQETAMLEQAKISGIPLERLQAAQAYVRPTPVVSATFDMSKLRPPKSFADQENDARLALLNATKKNDTVGANLAKADVLVFKTIKDSMNSEQTEFSNKVASLKNAAAFGTPDEKVKANKDLDGLFALERREAEAKKVRGDDGETKIPALSALNTFTTAAVARSLAAKYGDLIKSKQLAVVEKPDGSVSVDYVGTDPTLRREIIATQALAARAALSLYTDSKGQPANRDVATVLNSFTAPVAVTPEAPAVSAPAAPALPTARGLGSAPAGRNPAPAATPVSAPAVRSFRTVEEATAANLPVGTKITIGGRPAEVK
jgi:hypothetical protein